MFPLSEDTILYLLLAGVVAGVSVLAVSVQRMLGKSVFLVVLAFAIPVLVAFSMAPSGGIFRDAYVTYLLMLYGALWAGAVVAGAIWGRVLRAWVGGALAICLAVLPSLAAGGYLLERQRVPVAACAKRAVFDVGDQRVVVPRELSISSGAAAGGPAQVWTGGYGDWSGAKQSVRAYCAVSGGGEEPVRLGHLWITSGFAAQDRRARCEGAAVAAGDQAYCAAAVRAQLTVIQLYARDDGLAKPSMGQFNQDAMDAALEDGQRSGMRCNKGVSNPELPRFCSIWFNLTPQVLTVVAARLGPEAPGEDPVADARFVVERLLGGLRPG